MTILNKSDLLTDKVFDKISSTILELASSGKLPEDVIYSIKRFIQESRSCRIKFLEQEDILEMCCGGCSRPLNDHIFTYEFGPPTLKCPVSSFEKEIRDLYHPPNDPAKYFEKIDLNQFLTHLNSLMTEVKKLRHEHATDLVQIRMLEVLRQKRAPTDAAVVIREDFTPVPDIASKVANTIQKSDLLPKANKIDHLKCDAACSLECDLENRDAMLNKERIIKMENPRFHAAWKEAIAKAKADPSKKDRVEVIEKWAQEQQEEEMKLYLCGSSKVAKIYYKMVEEDLIEEVEA